MGQFWTLPFLKISPLTWQFEISVALRSEHHLSSYTCYWLMVV